MPHMAFANLFPQADGAALLIRIDILDNAEFIVAGITREYAPTSGNARIMIFTLTHCW